MASFNGSTNFATVAVHVGSEPDPMTGAVVPNISLATTYAQTNLGGTLPGSNDKNSFGNGYEYQRSGNPTRGAFERAIAACEGGKYGLAFSSGLGATAAIMQTLSQGDHVICIDDVYGGTQRQFRQVFGERNGLNFDFMDFSNPANLTSAIKSNTKIVWMESPTNPTLKITDVRAVSDAITSALSALNKQREDILLVVDNTFASPYLQNPLALGADIVLHSVTKYIGGHSDVVMGCLICNEEKVNNDLRYVQNAMGSVPAPFDCYMAVRGLKTLHVRMEAAMKNAMSIAQFLEGNNYVERVIYPGLESHPQHAIAKKQMKGYGAMITFYLKGNIDTSREFLKSMKLFTLAESLGAVESLAECPAVMTHASVPLEARQELGISDTLIRLSVGIEHIDDLIVDITKSLEAANAI
jgi:cystathionine gamma-lyase